MVIMPWRLRASICCRSPASRCSERWTIRRTSGSVILLSRSVSYWLNSEWTRASASARSTKPSRLVSRFWNSARARLRSSSSGGLLGASGESGGSTTLMNSSTVSLPSLLASSWSKDFMRYFRKSARVTSPFLLTSISVNQEGNGMGGGAVDACCPAGGAPGAGGVARGAWVAAPAGGAACAGGRLAGQPCVGGVCAGGVCAGGVWASAGNAMVAATRRIGARRRFIGGRPALGGVIRIGRHGPSVNVPDRA